MSGFRKKPIVIEAWQIPPFNGAFDPAPPSWLRKAIVDGRVRADKNCRGFLITTLEGEMRGDVGDWIIQGVKGELYPCKPDIFDATYEAVA